MFKLTMEKQCKIYTMYLRISFKNNFTDLHFAGEVIYTTLKSLSLIEKWSRKSYSRTKNIKEIMVYQGSEYLLQEISHRDILTFPPVKRKRN